MNPTLRSLDNRNLDDMADFHEERIECLRRHIGELLSRIAELEHENRELRRELRELREESTSKGSK